MAKKKPLTGDQVARLAGMILEIDFDVLVKRTSLTELKEQCQKKLGFAISFHDLAVARYNHCKWYKKVKRKAKSTSKLLTNEGWNELRYAVKSLSGDLAGRTLTEAVEVVCTKCSCNRSLLNGLTREYRVWK